MVIIELVLPLCCQEPPSPFPSTVTSPGDRTEVLAVFPASTSESAISKLSSMCWCHVHPQLTSLVWLHPSEPQEGLRSPNSNSFHETPVKSTVTLKHVQREDSSKPQGEQVLCSLGCSQNPCTSSSQAAPASHRWWHQHCSAGAAQGQPAQLECRAVTQKGQQDAVSWKISSAAELVEASSSPIGKRCLTLANSSARLPMGSFWH